MKIGFASGDWSIGAINPLTKMPFETPQPGGAGWYRAAMPADYLARNGIDTVLGSLIKHRKTGEFGIATWEHGDERWRFGDFDIIVMQRWMNEGLDDEIRHARALGQIIVQDVDDHFFGIDPRNVAFERTHPKNNPTENTAHYRRSLGASTAITVSTPFLAESLRRLNPNVYVIRNAIDFDRWLPHSVLRTPCTVGWVGAQPWRSGDLETLRGVLGPALVHLGMRFHHAGQATGATPAHELLGIDADRIECTESPMVQITEYPTVFDRFDIGLVPLSDRPFNHAKSCIKGIEYAAAGVPFVAAATPEYEWLRREFFVGRTARRPRDWRQHLGELADPETRAAEGKRQRAQIEPLDMRHRWPEWLDFYRSLL